jgi:hypothetical protein
LGTVLACLDPDPQTQPNPDPIRVRNTDFCRVKRASQDLDSLALTNSNLKASWSRFRILFCVSDKKMEDKLKYIIFMSEYRDHLSSDSKHVGIPNASLLINLLFSHKPTLC